MIQQNEKQCILFFIKFPEKGQVKTRLSSLLDEDIVVSLYQYFVLDLLATLAKINASVFICYTPKHSKDACEHWLGKQYHYISQEGKNLGERMKNCFHSVFSEGFTRVLLIGSDSPDLPSEIFLKAFQSLQTHDVVIGPSNDGGYYLLGLRNTSFVPQIFDEIPWSTSQVFQKTMQTVYSLGKTVQQLQPWDDIDTFADLQKLYRKNLHSPFKQSKTMKFLFNQKNKVPLD